jgi:hypothetical protein
MANTGNQGSHDQRITAQALTTGDRAAGIMLLLFLCSEEDLIMGRTGDSDKMLFRSFECFSNDGILDVDELDQILEIAMRDDTVDEDEKKVLKNIIYNLTSADLSPDLWERVEALIQQYGLDEPS